MNQLAKTEIAQRREHADDRGEQNHLDIIELVAAKAEIRLGRMDLASRHPNTLRRRSDLQEALDDFQRFIELIVMHPMTRFLDGNDVGVLEYLGAPILFPIARP